MSTGTLRGSRVMRFEAEPDRRLSVAEQFHHRREVQKTLTQRHIPEEESVIVRMECLVLDVGRHRNRGEGADGFQPDLLAG